MKVECLVEKLKSAAVICERSAGKNLSLPILSSVLIIASGKSLKLRATNLSLGVEIEIPAKVTQEGIAVVKADIFNNMLSSINSNQNIDLELVNDNLLIKTKQNTILLKSTPSDDFPTIPMVEGSQIEIPAKKILEAIKSVYFSASISDIRPETNSVYVYGEDDMLICVATDSFRLAEKRVKIKNIAISPILIPLKNTIEIIRILENCSGDIVLTTNKNQLSISYNGTYITSRLVDGIFPDYKQIIPKEHTTEVVVLKQDIISALKLANIFSDKFNQVNMTVSPIKKIFEINTKNNDVGENKTKIDGALTGETVEVSFNYKYLFDAFIPISQDSVNLEFNGANKPVVIQGGGDMSFTYLIMPINK